MTEYFEASKRLMEKALAEGDTQMLLDIKLLMDTVTKLQDLFASVDNRFKSMDIEAYYKEEEETNGDTHRITSPGRR